MCWAAAFLTLVWTLMAVLGIALLAIFMPIRFVLYKRFRLHVAHTERAAVADPQRGLRDV